MSEEKRLSVTFGAFSCEIIGYEDPVALLNRVVSEINAAAAANQGFGARSAPSEAETEAIPGALAALDAPEAAAEDPVAASTIDPPPPAEDGPEDDPAAPAPSEAWAEHAAGPEDAIDDEPEAETASDESPNDPWSGSLAAAGATDPWAASREAGQSDNDDNDDNDTGSDPWGGLAAPTYTEVAADPPGALDGAQEDAEPEEEAPSDTWRALDPPTYSEPPADPPASLGFAAGDGEDDPSDADGAPQDEPSAAPQADAQPDMAQPPAGETDAAPVETAAGAFAPLPARRAAKARDDDDDDGNFLFDELDEDESEDEAAPEPEPLTFAADEETPEAFQAGAAPAEAEPEPEPAPEAPAPKPRLSLAGFLRRGRSEPDDAEETGSEPAPADEAPAPEAQPRPAPAGGDRFSALALAPEVEVIDSAPGVPIADREIEPLADEILQGGLTAEGFARAVHAETLGDYLEAAAIYLVIVKGEASFSRRDVMAALTEMRAEREFSKNARLKTFRRLLTTGALRRVEDGLYAVSETLRQAYEIKLLG